VSGVGSLGQGDNLVGGVAQMLFEKQFLKRNLGSTMHRTSNLQVHKQSKVQFILEFDLKNLTVSDNYNYLCLCYPILSLVRYI